MTCLAYFTDPSIGAWNLRRLRGRKRQILTADAIEVRCFREVSGVVGVANFLQLTRGEGGRSIAGRLGL